MHAAQHTYTTWFVYLAGAYNYQTTYEAFYSSVVRTLQQSIVYMASGRRGRRPEQVQVFNGMLQRENHNSPFPRYDNDITPKQRSVVHKSRRTLKSGLPWRTSLSGLSLSFSLKAYPIPTRSRRQDDKKQCLLRFGLVFRCCVEATSSSSWRAPRV